jgi:hypothetical protein
MMMVVSNYCDGKSIESGLARLFAHEKNRRGLCPE